MKRFAWIIAAAALSVLTLAGCGKEETTINAPIENDYIKINKVEGLEVERVKVDKVTDDDVDEEIQSQLEGMTTPKTEVPDRAIEKGDTILLDCSAKDESGNALQGTTLEDYELEIGSDAFIEGWEDACVGKPFGEAFTFELKFPDDYGSEEIAGKRATWTVTAKGLVTGEEKAELNDETVKQLSQDSTTVEEYKKEVKKQLQEDQQSMSDQQLQQDIWEAIENETEVKKYPEDRINKLIDEAKSSYEQMAEQYGMSYEEFLEQNGLKEEELNSQMKEYAEETLKDELIVDLILDELGVEFSDDDYEDMYKDLAEKYGYGTNVDEFLEAATEDMAKSLARQNYVSDWLIDHADITEVDEKTLDEEETVSEDKDTSENEHPTEETADEAVADDAATEESADGQGAAEEQQEDKAAGDSMQ